MGGVSTAAYTPRFTAACNRVVRIEGGHTNDASDHGGETIYGISLRFLVSEGKIDANHDGFADFDLDMDGDIDGADIRLLTPDDARALYWRCFWQELQCESMPRPLGEAMFDQAVNGGLKTARKLLQTALNACIERLHLAQGMIPKPLVVDGAVGATTQGVFLWALKLPALGMPAIISEYRAAAATRYRLIVAHDPSQAKYLKGWLRRASELGAS